MDSAPMIASRSFPDRHSMDDSRPATEPENISSRMASSTGRLESNGARGRADNDSKANSLRQRRRKRLTDKGGRNSTARDSPPTSQQILSQQPSLHTVSEHKSMDHSRLDKEKRSLSADATAETTTLSAEVSEASRKMPFTPTDGNRVPHASESVVPLPQSIVTMTQNFPPSDEQCSPIQMPVPVRLHPMKENSSRALAAAAESLPSPRLIPRRQRQRSQSVWDETSRKERITQQRKATKRLPRIAGLSPHCSESKRSLSPLKRFSHSKTQSFDESNKRSHKPKYLKPKAAIASRPRPKLKRHSTDPTSSTLAPQTNVVDDVLMDRAFIIRQNLMNFEMQELAAEAEKAAESGLEKFVGSTSKFGVEDTPPYRPKFVDDGEFVVNGTCNNGGGLMMTPSRRKTLVDTLTYPMDYTPSYFSRKKIPVTSLRNFSEIVPDFRDMHDRVRLHLGRQGVHVATIPHLHSCRSLIKNDTDETMEREDEGDIVSQAPSFAASHTESISSFSSYAVASLASLKEIIDYVNRPRSPMDSAALQTSASMSNASHNIPIPKNVEHPSPLRRRTLGFSADRKRGFSTSLPHTSAHFKPAVESANSDSDDSSVEFYGRKSPIDLNQNASSCRSERAGMNQWKTSPSQPRSSICHGDITRKIGTTPSVSFETEKASYQALLDKMHNLSSPSVSFDVDQNSCAPSLVNIDIDILSSSPTSTNKSSTPMANFLSKIGFSRSLSTDDHQRSNKTLDEDNEYFVANFFYTSQLSDNIVASPNGVPTLKLDINPERDTDPYCLTGCGPNNLLPACDGATKYAEFLFDWFNVRANNQSRKHNAIIDPKATAEQALNPKWMKTWEGNDSRRQYTPPKLTVNHTAPPEDDIFCSPKSTKLGGECDGAMACSAVREPVTCPEINKLGCSPE